MPNFNDLLPAPPEGFINVKWQKDNDGNISANYEPEDGGIPIQINSDEIGNAGVVGGGGDSPVDSVFGRTGDIVAVNGDYSASQITNAVDITGSYSNPSWITSLDYSKITGVPTPPVTVIPLVIGFVINDGTAGTDIGPKLISPRSGTITQCIGVVDASGVTNLSFEIKKNGTSIFTSPGIVTGGVAPGTVFTVTLLTVPINVALHDIFSIDIISGGSAWKFTAQLE